MNDPILVGPASVPVQSPNYYKRHLPHWRNPGVTYFVTWRLASRQPDLIAEERDVVVETLAHFQLKRYALFAYVVMNDHVHTLVAPHRDFSLQSVVHSWKSFSAHRMQREYAREGSVWQREYFDRIMRHEAEFEEKRGYILANPFKRWPGLGDYRWVDGTGTEAGPTRDGPFEK